MFHNKMFHKLEHLFAVATPVHHLPPPYTTLHHYTRTPG
nr:MAG TPA: hypothetical protein [Caudoviricetes sp.]